uniref:Transcriptional regulator n=1 Tax=Strongyloides papillosus TaxID=174720 RepID=A0A0N5CCR8_STREA
LSIGLTGQLADRLNKENEKELLELVTRHYKDPKDPNSYG